MNRAKPVILMCWGYHRAGWIKYFEELNEDFEFIYLFYLTKADESVVCTRNRRIYYRDYPNPAILLKKNRISRVVMMGLDGLQNIAINIEAKKMGLPTFYMMHGSATLAIEDYYVVKFNKRNLAREILTKKLGSWLFTYRFLLSALGWKNVFSFPKLVRYQLQQTRVHSVLALRSNQTELRNPGKYVVFSKLDVPYYMERDNVTIDRFIVLGNLEVTSFVKYAGSHRFADDAYLLYIETPLSVIKDNEFSMDVLKPAEYNELLKALSRQARSSGLRLKVKLHPYSYKNDYYFQDENIEYVRDASIEELVLNSHAVIGYNSSLLVPATMFKKTIILQINELDTFQRNVLATGACESIDYRELVTGQRELISLLASPGNDKSRFIDAFISPNTDGNAVGRLKEIFLS